MAVETEIEHMIVMIEADVEDYKKQLKEAEEATKEAEKIMNEHLGPVQLPGLSDDVRRAKEDQASLKENLSEAKAALSQYQQVMKQGATVTKSVETEQEKYGRQTAELSKLLNMGAISQETYNRSMEALIPNVIPVTEKVQDLSGAFVALVASMGAASELKKAFAAFQAQAGAELKLTAILQANGREVEELSADYMAFAKDLQETSRQGDQVTLGMLQQAEAFGVTGDAAKRAVQNAIALGDAHGIGARAALRMTARLEEGDAMMLQRYIPALKGVQGALERYTIAQEELNKMQAITKAMSETTGAQMARLRNQVTDLYEEFGKFVAQGVRPVVMWLRDLVTYFQNLSTPTKEIIVQIAAATAGLVMMSAIIPKLVAGFNLLTAGSLDFWKSLALNPMALYVAAALAAAYATQDLMNWIGKASGMTEELGRRAELNSEQIERFNKATKGILEGAVGSRETQATYLTEQLDRAKKELEEYEDILDKAKRKKSSGFAEDLGTAFFPTAAKEGLGPYEKFASDLGNMISDAIQSKGMELDPTATEEMKQYELLVKAAKDRVRELATALGLVKGPQALQTTLNAITKFETSLQTQIDTWGMTTNEVKLYEFALEGANEEQLALATSQVEYLEMMKDFERVDAAVKKVTDSFAQQADTFGMTHREIEIYKLAMEGATQSELQAAKDGDALLTFLEDEAAFYAKGAEMKKHYMNNDEKVAERQKEANELFKYGAINLETYNQMMEDTGKHLHEIHNLQVAAAGSADALSRIQAYTSMVYGEKAMKDANFRPENMQAAAAYAATGGLEPTQVMAPLLAIQAATEKLVLKKPIVLEDTNEDDVFTTM